MITYSHLLFFYLWFFILRLTLSKRGAGEKEEQTRHQGQVNVEIFDLSFSSVPNRCTWCIFFSLPFTVRLLLINTEVSYYSNYCRSLLLITYPLIFCLDIILQPAEFIDTKVILQYHYHSFLYLLRAGSFFKKVTISKSSPPPSLSFKKSVMNLLER